MGIWKYIIVLLPFILKICGAIICLLNNEDLFIGRRGNLNLTKLIGKTPARIVYIIIIGLLIICLINLIVLFFNL